MFISNKALKIVLSLIYIMRENYGNFYGTLQRRFDIGILSNRCIFNAYKPDVNLTSNQCHLKERIQCSKNNLVTADSDQVRSVHC